MENEKQEFNLSEKIWEDENIYQNYIPVINMKDVKEFIRLLKEEINDEAIKRKLPITHSSLDRLPLNYINEIIDKLAGDKLNGN